jgi:hypothetical protein
MKITYFARFTLLYLCYLLLPVKVKAQKALEPSQLKQFNITVNCEMYTIKTQVLTLPKNIKVNNNRVYLWYSSQKILETRGGFDGKLIHGNYSAFYLNNQLKEKGQIRYGLKNKEWKYWYSDGTLKEVIDWKRGLKHGKYLLYNDNGQLIAYSHFKNDKLNGKFYTYSSTGKILEKKRYKKGEEVIPKIKTKRLKLNKEKDEKEDTLKPNDSQNKIFKRKVKTKVKKQTDKQTEQPDKKKTITS